MYKVIKIIYVKDFTLGNQGDTSYHRSILVAWRQWRPDYQVQGINEWLENAGNKEKNSLVEFDDMKKAGSLN